MNHTYEIPAGGGIYVIWLSDTHFYGGRAKSFRVRWRRHLRALLNGTHPNKHAQNVFNKFGRFEPQVLVRAAESQELLEQAWLDAHLGAEGCLNTNPHAAGATGHSHSEESKRKMRNRTLSDEARRKISEALRGRTHTFETRRKISEGNKGRTLSAEHLQALRMSSQNREWTPELRERLSKALLGHVRSEASKAKQSATIRSRPDLQEKARASLAQNTCRDPEILAANARKASEFNRGRTQSPEHVEARAAKHRGRKNTPETLAKMSESAKRRAQETPTAHGAETRALISTQQAGRIWINDGMRNQRLHPTEAEPLLTSGAWQRGKAPSGALKGLLWLHRPATGERRRARLEELPALLEQGWERGQRGPAQPA